MAPAVATRPLGVEVVRLYRPHRDALPENTDYRDDGCELAPRCLDCPLAQCRYDVPGGIRAILNEERDAEIIALHYSGASVDEIARLVDASRRTVFRVLQVERERA